MLQSRPRKSDTSDGMFHISIRYILHACLGNSPETTFEKWGSVTIKNEMVCLPCCQRLKLQKWSLISSWCQVSCRSACYFCEEMFCISTNQLFPRIRRHYGAMKPPRPLLPPFSPQRALIGEVISLPTKNESDESWGTMSLKISAIQQPCIVTTHIQICVEVVRGSIFWIRNAVPKKSHIAELRSYKSKE